MFVYASRIQLFLHNFVRSEIIQKKGAHLKRKDANFEEKDAILKNLCAEMGKKFVTKGAILDKKGQCIADRLDNKELNTKLY